MSGTGEFSRAGCTDLSVRGVYQMEPGEPDGLPGNAVEKKLRDRTGRVIAVVRVVAEHDDELLLATLYEYSEKRDINSPFAPRRPRLLP